VCCSVNTKRGVCATMGRVGTRFGCGVCVLQCVLQCDAVCGGVLRCVAAYCGVLQCTSYKRSVCNEGPYECALLSQSWCVAVCCSVLQCEC